MNLFEKELLKYYSPQELTAIQSVKIGIGGAGGLGSNIAVMLARSGFKHFEIIDQDKIEISNLNRQCYFLEDVGKPKVNILKKYLLQINPHVQLTTHKSNWSKDNAGHFFKDCDYIIEAFDVPRSKKDFVEYYQDKTKFVISGNGMAGLRVISPIEVKKVGNIYFVGDNITDTQEGHPPLAPRVITCAARMCEIALNLTLSTI